MFVFVFMFMFMFMFIQAELMDAAGEVTPEDGGADISCVNSGGASLSRRPSTASAASSRPLMRARNKVTKNQNRVVSKKLCRGTISAGISASALKNPEFVEALNAIALFGEKFKCCDSTEVYRRYALYLSNY